jgi:hypothetical protein
MPWPRKSAAAATPPELCPVREEIIYGIAEPWHGYI